MGLSHLLELRRQLSPLQRRVKWRRRSCLWAQKSTPCLNSIVELHILSSCLEDSIVITFSCKRWRHQTPAMSLPTFWLKVLCLWLWTRPAQQLAACVMSVQCSLCGCTHSQYDVKEEQTQKRTRRRSHFVPNGGMVPEADLWQNKCPKAL